MRYFLVIISFCLALGLLNCQPEPASQDKTSAQNTPVKDTLLTLQNDQAILQVAQNGGAYVNFQLKAQPVNPYTWKMTPAEMPENNRSGAPFRGHFLCVGRWGAPSEGEIKAGVPHNGEPANKPWAVKNETPTSLSLFVDSPKDGLTVSRTVQLAVNSAAFTVEEIVKSNLSVGRLNNIVQHGTIGPPFLSATTRINSNAGPGFLQAMSYPNPNNYAFRWPQGYIDSLKTPLDLTSSATLEPYCTTHIFDKGVEHGWITATSPEHGLVLGYIWTVADYPWLNVWHHVENGKPVARGLEFGTTGIGRPYTELLQANTKFKGRNSFEYLDAGEQKTKKFTCFLLPVPKDFKEVAAVTLVGGNIVVQEKGSAARDFLVKL